MFELVDSVSFIVAQVPTKFRMHFVFLYLIYLQLLTQEIVERFLLFCKARLIFMLVGSLYLLLEKNINYIRLLVYKIINYSYIEQNNMHGCLFITQVKRVTKISCFSFLFFNTLILLDFFRKWKGRFCPQEGRLEKFSEKKNPNCPID